LLESLKKQNPVRNFVCMKIKQPDSARCPPLSMAMLEVGDDGTAVVVAQIKALMDAQDLPEKPSKPFFVLLTKHPFFP